MIMIKPVNEVLLRNRETVYRLRLQCRPAVECRRALYIDVKTFRLTLASQT